MARRANFIKLVDDELSERDRKKRFENLKAYCNTPEIKKILEKYKPTKEHV
jgi:hypothetical protein